MNLSTHTSRLAKAIGLVLTLTALAVPVAQGVVASAPERANPILRNDIAHFGNDSRFSPTTSSVRPDAATFYTPQQLKTMSANWAAKGRLLGSPDAATFYTREQLRAMSAGWAAKGRLPESPAAVVVRMDGGFDWISAGVGLASGLGLVLAIAVSASAVRARQHGHEARA